MVDIAELEIWILRKQQFFKHVYSLQQRKLFHTTNHVIKQIFHRIVIDVKALPFCDFTQIKVWITQLGCIKLFTTN